MEYEDRHVFERFDALRITQQELAQRGYYFYPVEKEHTEGLITNPLLNRLRTQIKKRGFERVASHVAITFTGYSDDPREVWQVPEVRSYWHQLDSELPELPALLAHLPQLNFNGPGQHLLSDLATTSYTHTCRIDGKPRPLRPDGVTPWLRSPG